MKGKRKSVEEESEDWWGDARTGFVGHIGGLYDPSPFGFLSK
jgi:hypothetical protein